MALRGFKIDSSKGWKDPFDGDVTIFPASAAAFPRAEVLVYKPEDPTLPIAKDGIRNFIAWANKLRELAELTAEAGDGSHPTFARVFDLGETEDGGAFLVRAWHGDKGFWIRTPKPDLRKSLVTLVADLVAGLGLSWSKVGPLDIEERTILVTKDAGGSLRASFSRALPAVTAANSATKHDDLAKLGAIIFNAVFGTPISTNEHESVDDRLGDSSKWTQRLPSSGPLWRTVVRDLLVPPIGADLNKMLRETLDHVGAPKHRLPLDHRPPKPIRPPPPPPTLNTGPSRTRRQVSTETIRPFEQVEIHDPAQERDLTLRVQGPFNPADAFARDGVDVLTLSGDAPRLQQAARALTARVAIPDSTRTDRFAIAVWPAGSPPPAESRVVEVDVLAPPAVAPGLPSRRAARLDETLRPFQGLVISNPGGIDRLAVEVRGDFTQDSLARARFAPTPRGEAFSLAGEPAAVAEALASLVAALPASLQTTREAAPCTLRLLQALPDTPDTVVRVDLFPKATLDASLDRQVSPGASIGPFEDLSIRDLIDQHDQSPTSPLVLTIRGDFDPNAIDAFTPASGDTRAAWTIQGSAAELQAAARQLRHVASLAAAGTTTTFEATLASARASGSPASIRVAVRVRTLPMLSMPGPAVSAVQRGDSFNPFAGLRIAAEPDDADLRLHVQSPTPPADAAGFTASTRDGRWTLERRGDVATLERDVAAVRFEALPATPGPLEFTARVGDPRSSAIHERGEVTLRIEVVEGASIEDVPDSVAITRPAGKAVQPFAAASLSGDPPGLTLVVEGPFRGRRLGAFMSAGLTRNQWSLTGDRATLEAALRALDAAGDPEQSDVFSAFLQWRVGGVLRRSPLRRVNLAWTRSSSVQLASSEPIRARVGSRVSPFAGLTILEGSSKTAQTLEVSGPFAPGSLGSFRPLGTSDDGVYLLNARVPLLVEAARALQFLAPEGTEAVREHAFTIRLIGDDTDASEPPMRVSVLVSDLPTLTLGETLLGPIPADEPSRPLASIGIVDPAQASDLVLRVVGPVRAPESGPFRRIESADRVEHVARGDAATLQAAAAALAVDPPASAEPWASIEFGAMLSIGDGDAFTGVSCTLQVLPHASLTSDDQKVRHVRAGEEVRPFAAVTIRDPASSESLVVAVKGVLVNARALGFKPASSSIDDEWMIGGPARTVEQAVRELIHRVSPAGPEPATHALMIGLWRRGRVADRHDLTVTSWPNADVQLDGNAPKSVREGGSLRPFSTLILRDKSPDLPVDVEVVGRFDALPEGFETLPQSDPPVHHARAPAATMQAALRSMVRSVPATDAGDALNFEVHVLASDRRPCSSLAVVVGVQGLPTLNTGPSRTRRQVSTETIRPFEQVEIHDPAQERDLTLRVQGPFNPADAFARDGVDVLTLSGDAPRLQQAARALTARVAIPDSTRTDRFAIAVWPAGSPPPAESRVVEVDVLAPPAVAPGLPSRRAARLDETLRPFQGLVISNPGGIDRLAVEVRGDFTQDSLARARFAPTPRGEAFSLAGEPAAVAEALASLVAALPASLQTTREAAPCTLRLLQALPDTPDTVVRVDLFPKATLDASLDRQVSPGASIGPFEDLSIRDLIDQHDQSPTSPLVLTIRGDFDPNAIDAFTPASGDTRAAWTIQGSAAELQAAARQLRHVASLAAAGTTTTFEATLASARASGSPASIRVAVRVRTLPMLSMPGPAVSAVQRGDSFNPFAGLRIAAEPDDADLRLHVQSPTPPADAAGFTASTRDGRWTLERRGDVATLERDVAAVRFEALPATPGPLEFTARVGDPRSSAIHERGEVTLRIEVVEGASIEDVPDSVAITRPAGKAVQPFAAASLSGDPPGLTLVVEGPFRGRRLGAFMSAGLTRNQWSLTGDRATLEAALRALDAAGDPEQSDVFSAFLQWRVGGVLRRSPLRRVNLAWTRSSSVQLASSEPIRARVGSRVSPFAGLTILEGSSKTAQTLEVSGPFAPGSLGSFRPLGTSDDGVYLLNARVPLLVEAARALQFLAPEGTEAVREHAFTIRLIGDDTDASEPPMRVSVLVSDLPTLTLGETLLGPIPADEPSRPLASIGIVDPAQASDLVLRVVGPVRAPESGPFRRIESADRVEHVARGDAATLQAAAAALAVDPPASAEPWASIEFGAMLSIGDGDAFTGVSCTLQVLPHASLTSDDQKVRHVRAGEEVRPFAAVTIRDPASSESLVVAVKGVLVNARALGFKPASSSIDDEWMIGGPARTVEQAVRELIHRVSPAGPEPATHALMIGLWRRGRVADRHDLTVTSWPNADVQLDGNAPKSVREGGSLRPFSTLILRDKSPDLPVDVEVVGRFDALPEGFETLPQSDPPVHHARAPAATMQAALRSMVRSVPATDAGDALNFEVHVLASDRRPCSSLAVVVGVQGLPTVSNGDRTFVTVVAGGDCRPWQDLTITDAAGVDDLTLTVGGTFDADAAKGLTPVERGGERLLEARGTGAALERLARQLTWRAPAKVEAGPREVRLHLGLVGRTEPLAEAIVELITVRVAPSKTPRRLLRIGGGCSPWAELVIASSSPDQLLTATVEGSVDVGAIAASGFEAEQGVLRLTGTADVLQRAVRTLRPASTGSATDATPGSSVVELVLRLEATTGPIAGATSRAAIELVSGPTMSLDEGPMRIRSGETAHPFESLRISDDPRADDVELVTEGPLTNPAGESRPEWRFTGLASEVEAAAHSLSHATRTSASGSSVVFAARLGTRASDPAARERRELRLDIARDPWLVAWRLAIAAVLLLGACAASWWTWTWIDRRSITIPESVIAWEGDEYPLRDFGKNLFDNGRTVSIDRQPLKGPNDFQTTTIALGAKTIEIGVTLPNGGAVNGKVTIKRKPLPLSDPIQELIVGRVEKPLEWQVFTTSNELPHSDGSPPLWLKLELPKGMSDGEGNTGTVHLDRSSKPLQPITLRASQPIRDGEVSLEGYAGGDRKLPLFKRTLKLNIFPAATLPKNTREERHVWQGESVQPFEGVIIVEKNGNVAPQQTPGDLRATVEWTSSRPNGPDVASTSYPPAEDPTAIAAQIEGWLQNQTWKPPRNQSGTFTATLKLEGTSSTFQRIFHVHTASELLTEFNDDSNSVDLRSGDNVTFPVADSKDLKGLKVKLSVTAPEWKVADGSGWTRNGEVFTRQVDAKTESLKEALSSLRPPTADPGKSKVTKPTLKLSPVFPDSDNTAEGDTSGVERVVQLRLHGKPKILPLSQAWRGERIDFKVRDTMPGKAAKIVVSGPTVDLDRASASGEDSEFRVPWTVPSRPGLHVVQVSFARTATTKAEPVDGGLFWINVGRRPAIISDDAPDAVAGGTIRPLQDLQVIADLGETFSGTYTIERSDGSKVPNKETNTLSGNAAQVTAALRNVTLNVVAGSRIDTEVALECERPWESREPRLKLPFKRRLNVVDPIERAIKDTTLENVKTVLRGMTQVQVQQGANPPNKLDQLKDKIAKEALNNTELNPLLELIGALVRVNDQPEVEGFKLTGIWDRPTWGDDGSVVLKLKDTNTKFRFRPAPNPLDDWYLAVDELGSKAFVEIYKALDEEARGKVNFPKDVPARGNYSGVIFDKNGKPSLLAGDPEIWSRNDKGGWELRKLQQQKSVDFPVTGLTPEQWNTFLESVGCWKIPPQSSYRVANNPIPIINPDLPRGENLPLTISLDWIGDDRTTTTQDNPPEFPADKKQRTAVSPENAEPVNLDRNVAELALKSGGGYAAIGPSWVSTQTKYDTVKGDQTAFYLGLRPAIQVRDRRWETWEKRRDEVLKQTPSPSPAR